MGTQNSLTSRCLRRLVAFLGLAPAVAGVAAAPFTAFPPKPEVDTIFSWVRDDAPGCSVAIAKAGKTIYSAGYGMADLDHKIPNTPGTVFHAASLAKQFTAMSILLLVKQNLIHLDDDVRDLIIPELDKKGLPKITICQMLHHISGIRDFLVLLTLAGWRWGDDVMTRADMLDLVGRMKTPNFDPGKAFSYSNTNYFLAGEIVARKTNPPKSLAQFARENIFVPLGMTSTRFIETYGETVSNRAYGYRELEPGFEMRMPKYDLTGPTNLVTTVEDLIRWDRNFDLGTVGGNAAIAEMLKAVPTPYGYGYGLGLMISTDGKIVEHNGIDPGFHSHLIRFPDSQLTVALLCNVELDPKETRKMVREVAAVFGVKVSAVSPADTASAHAIEEETPDMQIAPLAAAGYTGRYYSDEIDTTYDVIFDGKFKLTRQKHKPVELKLTNGLDTFKIDDFADDVLERVKVKFEKDKEGNIGNIRVDDNTGKDRLKLFPFRRLPQATPSPAASAAGARDAQ